MNKYHLLRNLLICLYFTISCKPDPEIKTIIEEKEIIVTEIDTVEIPIIEPLITSISPAEAHIGDTVHISGKVLSEAISVFFNSTEGTVITNFEDIIDVKVNPGSTTGKIFIQFADTTISTPSEYRIIQIQPVLEKITPDQGAFKDTISLTGENLDMITSIFFENDVPSELINPSSDTLLRFIVPENASSGLLKYNYSDTTIISSLYFEFNEEVVPGVKILNLLPLSNPHNGPVLILGENFRDVTSISFGDFNAPIKIKGDTFLTTNVPSGIDLGNVEFLVTNGNSADSKLFQVLGEHPNEPVSPGDIEIAEETPEDYVPPVSADWNNEFDEFNHYIRLDSHEDGQESGSIEGAEEWFDRSGEFRVSTVSGSFSNGAVSLTIDRGELGTVTYSGSYDGTKKRMILYSDISGRQLVIY